MSQSSSLSDKGLSILTFAAYHSLVSGEKVSRVVLDDGKGHHADPDGVREMEEAGYFEPEGERGTLTESGLAKLDAVMSAIRSAP